MKLFIKYKVLSIAMLFTVTCAQGMEQLPAELQTTLNEASTQPGYFAITDAIAQLIARSEERRVGKEC
jgi:hypothetical protein